MENEFKEVMSKRTDEELINIVTVQREGYKPQAIEAAEAEITKRNIAPDKFKKVKEEAIIEKEKEESANKKQVNNWIRLLNFIIDMVVWLIIAFVLTFPLNANNPVHSMIGYLILFGTFIGYYSIMEIKFQKTVGKFLTKTKVVTMDGERPTNGDVFTRTFCRFIPFDRLSFFFSKHGIHDSLSKTTVIKDNSE